MTIAEGTNVFHSLEELIDANSVKDVLDAVVRICEAKAEHLRENWQDQNMAKVWTKTAVLIEHAHDRIIV